MTRRGEKKKSGEHVGPEWEWDEAALPAPVREAGSKKVYFPFGEMEVGRSFTTHRVIHTVRAAVRLYRKEENAMERQFVARLTAEGKTRCWRMK